MLGLRKKQKKKKEKKRRKTFLHVYGCLYDVFIETVHGCFDNLNPFLDYKSSYVHF